jgi:hypothetical protein
VDVGSGAGFDAIIAAALKVPVKPYRPAVDNFGGTAGEQNARAFDVYGYTFLDFKPH